MLDQIREQIAASDHVEATRHRLENVRWDRIVPLAMSFLVVAVFAVAVAVLFVVFAGARNSAVPATREQSSIVRVPSRAPVPVSELSVASAKVPIVEPIWKPGSEFVKNPDQKAEFLSSEAWNELNETLFATMQLDAPYLYPSTPEKWHPGGLSYIVAHGNTWVALWSDDTCIENCSPESLFVTRGIHRPVYSLDEGKTWRELAPPPGYNESKDPTKGLRLLGLRGAQGLTVFDEGDWSRIVIATTAPNDSIFTIKEVYEVLVRS
ncbi:MAG: hypothetical protein A2842_02505 [Candidatus Wildermuthbacteria bacterium RIFCSPHIGHO2_01_FULL_48_25]|uniref:Uncharacterized protein n=1 Tax=Candidatus Wildermuthbacteria bacterium RIFCSPLOWO2_01_FULL_48_16 TaxID=1802461 RepID=A0A1G2RJ79_9BACT|nr:MAG: hypothetical protein A2842_02505 [Candidatus Wildermuthbacteria bacterium RIFCSPHIGHO2_01_FULL_48_25]OHA72904.1 MAG: hypothetical protein A3B24_03355 [Candidatus Wildermuthbacteria bacterium RIFCSPLOWO2_01_FULL_48_16]